MSPIIYTYWNGWMSVVENIMYLRRYLETLFKMLEDLGEGKKCPLSLHSHAPRVKNCNRKSYLQVSLLLILNYVYLRNLLALVLKKKIKRRRLSERRIYLSCYRLFHSSCFSNDSHSSHLQPSPCHCLHVFALLRSNYN